MTAKTSPARVVKTGPSTWEVRTNDGRDLLLITAHDTTSLALFLEAIRGLCSNQIELQNGRFGDAVNAA